MAQPLLPGEVDNRDEIILRLTEENDGLKQAVRDLETANAKLRAETNRALAGIRKALRPQYDGLRQLFGEMDAVSCATESGDAPAKQSGIWEKWKSQLPGKRAEAIQALLDHGELTIPQLRVAIHCGQQTAYDVTSALNKLGLINKNGGRYSLKKL